MARQKKKKILKETENIQPESWDENQKCAVPWQPREERLLSESKMHGFGGHKF